MSDNIQQVEKAKHLRLYSSKAANQRLNTYNTALTNARNQALSQMLNEYKALSVDTSKTESDAQAISNQLSQMKSFADTEKVAIEAIFNTDKFRAKMEEEALSLSTEIRNHKLGTNTKEIITALQNRNRESLSKLQSIEEDINEVVKDEIARYKEIFNGKGEWEALCEATMLVGLIKMSNGSNSTALNDLKEMQVSLSGANSNSAKDLLLKRITEVVDAAEGAKSWSTAGKVSKANLSIKDTVIRSAFNLADNINKIVSDEKRTTSIYKSLGGSRSGVYGMIAEIVSVSAANMMFAEASSTYEVTANEIVRYIVASGLAQNTGQNTTSSGKQQKADFTFSSTIFLDAVTQLHVSSDGNQIVFETRSEEYKVSGGVSVKNYASLSGPITVHGGGALQNYANQLPDKDDYGMILSGYANYDSAWHFDGGSGKQNWGLIKEIILMKNAVKFLAGYSEQGQGQAHYLMINDKTYSIASILYNTTAKLDNKINQGNTEIIGNDIAGMSVSLNSSDGIASLIQKRQEKWKGGSWAQAQVIYDNLGPSSLTVQPSHSIENNKIYAAIQNIKVTAKLRVANTSVEG